MEPGEALSTAAQIAVTLAGFAGVVVAFRSGPLHEWPLIDRYRLWLLLGNALVPLFASLFGILLLTIKPMPLYIWHFCSGFWLLLIIPFVFLTQRRQTELGSALKKELGAYRYVFYTFAAVGTANTFLQVYNALFKGAFWLFYSAVAFQLALGTFQFARMILLPPQARET
jgi:hypothetical protein